MLASEMVQKLQERIAESGDAQVSAVMVTEGPVPAAYEIEDISWGSGAGVDEVNKNPGEILVRIRERPAPKL